LALLIPQITQRFFYKLIEKFEPWKPHVETLVEWGGTYRVSLILIRYESTKHSTWLIKVLSLSRYCLKMIGLVTKLTQVKNRLSKIEVNYKLGSKPMEYDHHTDKEKFFYPQASYRGQIKPQNLIFNANLQEFSHKVSYITNLETSGKLAPKEAYDKIQVLWKQLKHSKKELGIGNL
jgi:hypothetical protein